MDIEVYRDSENGLVAMAINDWNKVLTELEKHSILHQTCRKKGSEEIRKMEQEEKEACP